MNEHNIFIHQKFSEIFSQEGETIGVFRTAVQYFPDPEATVKEILSYGLDYILFLRLPAGEIPDFFSIQNFLGKKHPFRFFNLENFTRFIEGLGYEVGCRCGETEFFSMGNFPLTHRLEQTMALLFVKKINMNAEN